MENNMQSVLKMNKIVFDKINFERLGLTSKEELNLEITTNISKRQDADIYRVMLCLKGKKPEEYTLEINLVGFFSFDNGETLDELQKNDLISKNAVAIMMPYLRSEVSLLTAQPGVECVVLPPFNINKMMKS